MLEIPQAFLNLGSRTWLLKARGVQPASSSGAEWSHIEKESKPAREAGAVVLFLPKVTFSVSDMQRSIQGRAGPRMRGGLYLFWR